MIPTNIRRADELKWKEQVLRQSACKCQHQPQSQQSTPPPPAYSSTTPTRQPKKFYNTSDPSESKFGHCKAVRKGPFVYVSALKGSDPKTGKVAYPRDVASQTRQALREGLKAVNALGGKGAEDIMRVRMYIKSPEFSDEAGSAFWSQFGKDGDQMGCAMTMVIQKDGFIDPEALVEVEMDAVVDA